MSYWKFLGCSIKTAIGRTHSGWWLTNPSEKYEFVNGKDDIPYIYILWKNMENKIHVPNHQPALNGY